MINLHKNILEIAPETSVKVILSDYGIDVYQNYLSAFNSREDIKTCFEKSKFGEFNVFQLYQLMNIFGTCFALGKKKNPFIGNIIILGEE